MDLKVSSFYDVHEMEKLILEKFGAQPDLVGWAMNNTPWGSNGCLVSVEIYDELSKEDIEAIDKWLNSETVYHWGRDGKKINPPMEALLSKLILDGEDLVREDLWGVYIHVWW